MSKDDVGANVKDEFCLKSSREDVRVPKAAKLTEIEASQGYSHRRLCKIQSVPIGKAIH